MKRAVLAVSLLAFFSCQQREAAAPDTAATATTATAPAAKPLRVGLLTPGSINDGGCNAIA